MRIINSKFNSTCSETGCRIKKGEQCVYDERQKKVFAITSTTAIKFKNGMSTDAGAGMLEAQQDQYFENWYHQTYPNEF